MKVLLFKPVSLLDKLICFFTRGSYQHVSILLNNGTIIESKPFKGVRILKSINVALESNPICEVCSIDVSPYQIEDITSFLISQIGKKYDYASALGFAFFTNKEDRESRNRWFCSELVFTAFSKSGIELLKRIPAWKVSPSMIAYSNLITVEYIKIKD